MKLNNQICWKSSQLAEKKIFLSQAGKWGGLFLFLWQLNFEFFAEILNEANFLISHSQVVNVNSSTLQFNTSVTELFNTRTTPFPPPKLVSSTHSFVKHNKSVTSAHNTDWFLGRKGLAPVCWTDGGVELRGTLLTLSEYLNENSYACNEKRQ